MRILLVDDDPFFRALVSKFLERDLPQAQMSVFEPEPPGATPPAGGWESFDVLMLSHEVGALGTGIDWLRRSVGSMSLPPVLYFTDTGNEALARSVIEAGAAQVMRKDELSGTRLAQQLSTLADPSLSGSVALPPQRLPIIQGYKLANLVGEGAKSRVYLGERERDGLTVVLKVIDLDLVNEHAHVKRFLEEAELVTELRSPHVVRVYDHGFTDDCGFMAMEFFPRGDLKHRIEHGLSPADALHCLANIAYGLEAIHAVGIVHRDLKPANVMFRHDDTLALADFGISQRLATDSELSTTGRVLGTPHYMSPEQGRGRPVDVRNDLYSLGVMFYEMLTGDKPFRGATPAALVYEHINTPLPLLQTRLRRYQPLLEKLLAKDPAQRFPSASELLAAL